MDALAELRPTQPVANAAGTSTETPSGELVNQRPANRGQFQLGNTKSLRHGGRSTQVQDGKLPEQADAVAALADAEARINADLGGVDVSATKAGYVGRHVRLELVEHHLWGNLERLGMLTAKGNRRAALTAWLAVVDRLHRSAVTLGLERKTKQISLPEYLADLARRREAEEQEAEQAARGQDVGDDGDGDDQVPSGRAHAPDADDQDRDDEEGGIA